MSNVPKCLSIAGSDCAGGAGILGDTGSNEITNLLFILLSVLRRLLQEGFMVWELLQRLRHKIQVELLIYMK